MRKTKQIRAMSHRQAISRLLKDRRFRRGYEEELEQLRKKAVTSKLGEQYTDKRIAELLKADRIDAKTASRARRLLGS